MGEQLRWAMATAAAVAGREGTSTGEAALFFGELHFVTERRLWLQDVDEYCGHWSREKEHTVKQKIDR